MAIEAVQIGPAEFIVAAEQLQVGDAFADDDYAWLVVGEPVEAAAGALLVLVASRPGRKPATSSRPTCESAAGSQTEHRLSTDSAQTGLMPRRVSTHPPAGLPRDLAGPVVVELTKAVDQIPGPHALPGGCAYEPKWDGYLH